MTRVLILSSTQDLHAMEVMKNLDSLSCPYTVLRFEEFRSGFKLRHIIGGQHRKTDLEIGEKKVDLQEVKSIWHRRPGLFIVPTTPEPYIGQMIELETRDSISGILNSLSCLWVNRPLNDTQTMRKLLQLEYAKQVGMEVPLTLVTTDPESVEKFFDECDGQVIYKLIGETTGQFLPRSEIIGIPTLPLRKSDLKHLKQVAHAPHLFQKMIAKVFDVRVTVIGKKLFGCRIHSQSGRGTIDWRGDYSVDMQPVDISNVLQEQIFSLMKRFRLNYAAFDFCELADGQMVFIEVNSAGQYIWMEERTKQPLSLEMAKLLAGESEPLCAQTD
ncbi:MAG TPA: hypothetical protein V6C76_14425 [Drouetiella sp.]